MARLNKDDLAQMNEDYFESLDQKRLVQVAKNLHLLAIEQWEKINSDSGNSSQPPSSDNPFKKQHQKSSFQEKQTKESKPKRKPGRQKGSKGFGRSQILKVDKIIPHYPERCSACNQASMTYG